VERIDNGEFIGFVGLSSPGWQAWFTPCVEIGWRLGRQHWGNGFAPEAARAALAWGFDHVELPNDEVVSFTTVANAKSRRVMEKIGLRHDPARDFDHPLLPDWVERRHVLYAIDRRRFGELVAR
jgi:ribosomal-protein-alanine N-acetyltransferase